MASNPTIPALVPIRLQLSLESGGQTTTPITVVVQVPAQPTPVQPTPAQPTPVPSPTPPSPGDPSGLPFRIPIIFDQLDQRTGFARDFLGPAAALPMPVLTPAGEAVAAKRLDGGGTELKYHKFSVWMHAARRLALFTASNVDFRVRSATVDGQPVNRASLRGFGDGFLEEWVPDARIAITEQLPDVFFSQDRGAFDKGHLVRRDDVAWGPTFADIQKSNGDTYHVTNCSPQIAGLNQATRGVDNWGDLEDRIATSTRQDGETCIVYAGPILAEADRLFSGRDQAGAVRVQIPSLYWKIVLVAAPPPANFRAFGFLIRQNVDALTDEEISFGANWNDERTPIAAIEALLRGWIDLSSLTPFDTAP